MLLDMLCNCKNVYIIVHTHEEVLYILIQRLYIFSYASHYKPAVIYSCYDYLFIIDRIPNNIVFTKYIRYYIYISYNNKYY